MNVLKRIAVVALGLLVLLSVAAANAATKRPRPSEVVGAETSMAPNDFQVYNDYATPKRTYSSGRAVVHYVLVGIDAPPLNDDDADSVPDYVERVGQAADRALTYYERRGFRPPLPTKADRMRSLTSTSPVSRRGRSALHSRTAERKAARSPSSRTTSTRAQSAASRASTPRSRTSFSILSSSPTSVVASRCSRPGFSRARRRRWRRA